MRKKYFFVLAVALAIGLLFYLVNGRVGNIDKVQNNSKTIEKNVSDVQNKSISPNENNTKDKKDRKIDETSKTYSSRYEIDRAKGKTVVLTFDAGADGS